METETESIPSHRIRAALDACLMSLESGDLDEPEAAVTPVIDTLNSFVEPPQSDGTIVDDTVADDVLREILRFLSSPSSNQMVVDALSLELPKVLVNFAAFSEQCRKTVDDILELLISMTNPRDMFIILCEELDKQVRETMASAYFIPLLIGLSKVLVCIKSRHLEQVKVAMPVILKVIQALSLGSDQEDKAHLTDTFAAAINIGTSIQSICCNMVEMKKDGLRSILALYVLQNIALVSRSKHEDVISSNSCIILEFSKFLPFCGFSFVGLITGANFSSFIDEILKEDCDELLPCFSLAAHGAALAALWAYISDEIAKAAGGDFMSTSDRLRKNPKERWQTIATMQPVLSLMDYPWELKSHAIDLLFSILEKTDSEEYAGDFVDFSSFEPGLLTALQAIQRIMIGASKASLRKKAFVTLRKVISDIPISYRFDILKALITNSNSSSMIAILIDVVREELVSEVRQERLFENGEQIETTKPNAAFWSSHALDLVELILKPPKGGPPTLPEDSDSVLSALNLFRFILLIESKEKTNYTGVMSEVTLRKAYAEWLLPLRTLVSGIEAENIQDKSELSVHIHCALNPVQLVLYRCIELVEDSLKHSK